MDFGSLARPITPTRAGASGVLGVFFFAATLVFLTVSQYEFMLSIGWRPLGDPGNAWPSGLALGPYGWVMDVSFVVSGAFLVVFALGLRRTAPGIGAVLLVISGLAMSFMAFETDPITREGPRSVRGWIHDTSFVVFAASLLASTFFLWKEFGRHAAWRLHARHTLATGLVGVVCLLLPGVAYYVFIAVLLAWITATAIALRRAGVPAAPVRTSVNGSKRPG